MEKFLITGGSGFLGTALVERLQEHNLVILSRNEGNLVKLKEKYPNIEIIVGDIRDKQTCRKALNGVTGVFHLAAMKHVGLAEENPRECVMSNLLGTINLLDEFRGDFFLFISTDKAEKVSSVYGATKFISEKLLKEYEKINKTKYRIVRYGNVLYSTGSVLCKWKDKIAKGEEITVTDLDSTRFYWTVGSAINLIFECLEKATDCTPYCPEMKSITMKDLVGCMLEKYGEVPIKLTGLQPGENKHELCGGKWSNEVSQYTKEEIMEMI